MSFTESLAAHRGSGRALLGCNFYNAETLLAILRAAKRARCEIILQASPSTLDYLGLPLAVAMARSAAQQLGVRAWLHLDHGEDPALVRRCIEAGFDSVMLDASARDLETNLARTREIVQAARGAGTAVEAELGHVGAFGSGGADESAFTVPVEAERFVRETGVDMLAVAIGTVHGFYRGEPRLDLERLARIYELTGLPLVLHGGSGLSADQWRQAMARGIAKINFASEVKSTFTRRLKSSMTGKDEIDLRRTFPPAMDAVTDLVAEKLGICQTTGGGA